MNRDYYSILQVNRKASAEEIERSYQRLSRLYDPEQSRKRHARERWAQIQEAYDVLSDPAKRAEYDRGSRASTIPGLGRETAVTRFLTSRWGLPTLGGIIGMIVLAAVLAAIFSGDDGGEAVLGSPTPEPGTPTPAPTPAPLDGEEVVTESGLTIIMIEEGTGGPPALGDTAVVHYTGWLQDSLALFDTSTDGAPFEVTLGVDNVIEGWVEGLQLIPEGGKARLIIPPLLGYGEGQAGPIPPNSTLIFDIEMVEVLRGEAPPDESEAPSPSPEATASPEAGS